MPPAQGLYNPSNKNNACGVGFGAHFKGKKSPKIVQKGLRIRHNLNNRFWSGPNPLMGNGPAILFQIPNQNYRKKMARQGGNLPPEGKNGSGLIFLPKNNASPLAGNQKLNPPGPLKGQFGLACPNLALEQGHANFPHGAKNETVKPPNF
ncbi:hypothetical protein [Ralstonia solanacearum]|uniref:hypothetical protein n=1 Tax=Ralstonia solanacearum TaxID=305 RepID=UPI000B1D5A73|nr:hypothetical protein [Ralstonia solanacearum]